MVMLITTSRNPTHYLRRMSKIIALSIPSSQRLTRGNLNLSEIFRYCWNHQILRLLILQKYSDKNSIFVKAYSIEEKPRLINATIKITEIVTLQKHDKTQRIMIKKLKLAFTDQISKGIKQQITDFFSPTIQSLGNNDLSKLLTINFEKTSFHSVIGHAVQQNVSKSLPLFKIHIASECNNNE
ncbi:MAG: hypothetical protein ACFFC6_05915 [Promethearchaeota archaeon]